MRRTVHQLQAHAMRRRSLAVDRLILAKAATPGQLDQLKAWVYSWHQAALRLERRGVITS